MGGKPPVNRYLRVSPEQAKDWNLSCVGFVASFFAAPPYPRSSTDSWLYGRGTDGKPLFVAVFRRGEGRNLGYIGFVAGFFVAAPRSENLTNNEWTEGSVALPSTSPK
jgi:hypothetical protein